MTGVSSTLHFPRTTAYCLAAEGGHDGGPCPFFLEESPEVAWETVYADARQHIADTGHLEVYVDEMARTVYAPVATAVAS